ncbi:MAG: RusA family crossover junction endodeoxyribonuclease [Acidobacteria bacterium]|nr:RusA family crossover junction endodeoxyribonuclease [Acidobacteriota bacterium]
MYNPSEGAEQFVQACYIAAYGKTEPVAKVTFRLTCVFYTKNRRVVDVDNLWKLVADALQGLVWRNDSQVWDVGGTHREVDKVNPRTVVTIDRSGY